MPSDPPFTACFFYLNLIHNFARKLNGMEVIVLGHGYLANTLVPLLQSQGHAVISTSRRAQRDRIEFDLARPDTWNNLPQTGCTIWTFPPNDVEAVKVFYSQTQKRLGRLIVVGSTSCFLHQDGDTVDETFHWDLSRPRVQAEKYLQDQGAIVVISSGIYGPQRNPLDWLRKGLIQDPNRIVNLIHVEDLARACLAAMQRGHEGQSYIITDDKPLLWSEIVQRAQSHGELLDFKWSEGVCSTQRSNKKLNNTKATAELKLQLKFPSFSGAPVLR